MIGSGRDTCDGDGCGVTSDLHPFPHLATCRYGTGQPPICGACRHPADTHQHGPDGPHCHGCFLDGSPSHHRYTLETP